MGDMERIFLADKNRLFRQSLKFFLEKERLAQVIADENHIENLSASFDANSNGILIGEFIENKKYMDSIKAIGHKYRDIKIVLTAYSLNNNAYSTLINSGVKGCLLKNGNLNDVKDALNEVSLGKIYFPPKILEKVMAQYSGEIPKDNNLTERELEVLSLLCEGYSNEDISQKLHVSCDTIKWHRSNIFMKCDCKNILALYKYAVNAKLIQA